jgi:hypothetical protein
VYTNRLVVIVAHVLEMVSATAAAGNCVNVFGTLLGFTIFEPLVLYFTLLQVSIVAFPTPFARFRCLSDDDLTGFSLVARTEYSAGQTDPK